MKTIPLPRGLVATVDDEDWQIIRPYRWHWIRSNHTFYAQSTGSLLSMHRLVMNAPAEAMIDHRDHNGLNNCKDNLRWANCSLNGANRVLANNNTSGFKGVFFRPDRKRPVWQARLERHGKGIYVGSFASARAAAEAYDCKARELWGEFAATNASLGLL